MPAGEIAVMVLTVIVVVATHNLAIGVVVGTITAMVIFAKRVAHLAHVTAVTDPDGTQVVYAVTGELFFASSNDLVSQFDYAGDPDEVVIDLSAAHIWDASSVAALDAIETKYAQRGKTVEITGLNDPSADLHGRLTRRTHRQPLTRDGPLLTKARGEQGPVQEPDRVSGQTVVFTDSWSSSPSALPPAFRVRTNSRNVLSSRLTTGASR